MGRALLVATLLVISSPTASAQALSTLHITVTLADATGKTTSVARHALLISEEPPSTVPRRTFTTLTGTADGSLRPGRYAVESDKPVAFEGKSYEWSQRVDIVAGRSATLKLTADNASVGTSTAWDWSVVQEPSLRFENLVAGHLLKWVHHEQDAKGRDLELRYFRDTDRREVDFVVVERRAPQLFVECTWGDAEVDRGLRYLKARFPTCEAWQISATGTKDYVTPDDIRVAPAMQLLSALV